MLKKYETNFDYNDMEKADIKKAVLEVMNVLRKQGISENIIKDLELKFKIKQPKTYDLTKSPFYNYANSIGIDITINGHVATATGTKDEMRYPIVAICEDIRKLELLMVDLNLNASK